MLYIVFGISSLLYCPLMPQQLPIGNGKKQGLKRTGSYCTQVSAASPKTVMTVSITCFFSALVYSTYSEYVELTNLGAGEAANFLHKLPGHVNLHTRKNPFQKLRRHNICKNKQGNYIGLQGHCSVFQIFQLYSVGTVCKYVNMNDHQGWRDTA